MRLYISTGSGIAACSSGRIMHAPLPGSGALCASGRHLFCAGREDRAVWRLDSTTLMPQAVFPAGPGVCDLCLSGDRKRLFALLGEADSVLMCDAKTGAALVVSRCGVNPRRMRVSGELLVVAGGESCRVHLFDIHTLEDAGTIAMPGPVQDAALTTGGITALCLTQTPASVLVTCSRTGRHVSLPLGGMPGALLVHGGGLLCGVHGALYSVSADGRLLGRRRAPGCASRLGAHGGDLLLCDALSERLYTCKEHGAWTVLHEQSADFAVNLTD